MSINIVSAMPPTAQSASSASVGTSAAAGAGEADSAAGANVDFAALLISQQLLGLQAASASPDKSTTATDTATAADVTSTKDKSDTDDGATNANAIFAALGLIGNVPENRVTPVKGDGDAAATAVRGDGKAATSLAELAQSPGKPTTTDDGQGLAAASATSVQADDRPAKFAVDVTAQVEPAEQKKTTATENPTVNVAQLPTNASASHREAPLTMQTHVRDKDWSSEFTQKIVWMAGNDKQSAQLTLNPPQMGPIEISVNVEKGSATASFVSPNAEVRDAIETALPRLREMFANAGISLGQTNVSSESFRQPTNTASNWSAPQTRSDNDILAPTSVGPLTTRAFQGLSGNGLVDLFA